MATTCTLTYQDSWLEGVKMKKALYLLTINTYSEVGPIASLSTYLPNYCYGMKVISGDTRGIDLCYIPGSENGADLGTIQCRWGMASEAYKTQGSLVSAGSDLSSLVNVYVEFYGY